MRGQHTPGPWAVDWETSNLFTDFSARAWINADGLNHIGYVDGPNTAERRANAFLISAAPELLKTLKVLADYVDERAGDNECRPLENARAAISAAEGA